MSSELYTSTVLYHLEPIRHLLEDNSVSEVMINGIDGIYIERKGKVTKAEGVAFGGEEELMAACINIAQFSGSRIDEEKPRLDGRLPDGSRVHVIIPPVSPKISIAIRKFSNIRLDIEELIAFGALSRGAAEFLQTSILMKKNLLVSGGTGSGKTTLLNVLADYMPDEERVLTLEDTRELKIKKPHLVSMECRPADRFGRGEVTMRDLLHSTLRMRPDRIIMGEVRGGEALDLLNALNSGHGGTMTTLHADTPLQALAKLETLVLFAGEELPARAVRAQVCNSVQLVVQTSRYRDGSRKIDQISEVLPQLDEHGSYQLRSLFRFLHEGRDEDGTVRGAMKPTGVLPSYLPDLMVQGYPQTEDDFDPHQSTEDDPAALKLADPASDEVDDEPDSEGTAQIERGERPQFFGDLFDEDEKTDPGL